VENIMIFQPFGRKLLTGLSAVFFALQPILTQAEDIDIFVGSSAGTSDRPNVLFVLDNTSNWARQSQQWPGGIQQGQAEVRAIKTLLSSIGNDFNIGVLEFVTNGNANDNGGFIRYPAWEMTPANKTTLSAQMDTIFGDINGTNEKRNSNTNYGNLFYDVYNYFSGSDVSDNGNNHSKSLNPPSAQVNSGGYSTNYSKFSSILSCSHSCARNYVILISNPNSSGPADDLSASDQTNKTILSSLGGDTHNIALPLFSSQTTTSSVTIGNTNSCYASQSACTTAVQGSATSEFPAECPTPNSPYLDASGNSSCTCGATPVTDTGACPSGSQKYSVIATDAQNSSTGYTLGESSCGAYNNTNACESALNSLYPTLCPAVNGTGGVTCSCISQTNCGGGSKKWTLKRYKSSTTTTNLGYTTSCYSSQASCSTSQYASQCSDPISCACGNPTTTGSSCATGTNKYPVSATSTQITAAPTGLYDATGKGSNWMLDEWARFLYQKGVPVTGCDNQIVATYTIDVYNKQQNADHTALMMSTAKVGGGKYFAATDETALVNALKKIFQEIKSVNSVFASASLPVNATNRAQNENQVFIGMFRPDPEAKPRWFGNLKRYQLVLDADKVTVKLGDKDGVNAINDQTGFVDDCASSWWTTDSPLNPGDLTQGYYWANVPINPNPASQCTSIDSSKVYSDLPDGPTVEKGAVAEVIRKGNNPPATDSTPTWATNRQFYTTNSYTSTGLISGAGNAGALSSTQQNWVGGQDTQNEDVDASTTETRASIHGDVVHSRPLPVNYGSEIIVYYGANDGNFRAVNAETGQELWSLMPYEFAQTDFVDRLRTNEPLVSYPSVDMTISPTPIPKNYGWDGSIGILQNADNSKVWIYPTMRRGGRRVYSLDVTTPSAPSIKWIVGCNNDGSNCSSGFSNIGQTWSAPNLAPVAGYSTELVAFFGGGYDTCEDANTDSPSCSSPKGANVYAVDAGSGTLLKAFSTTRSVAADIALLDITGNGKADYAYVADTGGNLYRIDMVSRSVANGVTTYTALSPSSWTIRKIASTSGGGRKFLFAPVLSSLAQKGKVFVAIGSGDREHPLESHYPYSSVLNRFYVYLDDLSVTSGSAINLDALQNKTTDLGCSSTDIASDSSPAGWFINLNQYGQGEQTVTSAVIVGGLVAFSTNRPIPAASGSCSTPLGEARGYWVNLWNASGAVSVDGMCGGSRSTTFVGGGLPPSPVIGTVPINGKPTTVVLGAAQQKGGASAPIAPQKPTISINPIRKRVYWKLQGVD
jgi:Tfp pilus tip-associated adhesin PilY1